MKNEIIGEVKSLRLNRARIDLLIEQLYEINKRLVGLQGHLMRLAESHGVSRKDFLKHYLGSELDPLWLNRVSKLSGTELERISWRATRIASRNCARQIHTLATVTGMEIGVLLKIVYVVQKGEREGLQAKKEMVESGKSRPKR